MCGFCGEVSFDGARPSLANIATMTDVLYPRGPNAMGVSARDGIALGHCRLSIIDLSEKGQQPMTDPDLGLTLAFNGCIYNYADLRAELEAKGHRFFSHSDTEVILKAYAAWGPLCVKRFNGMFAFAISEHATGRLVLARDRLGIKPLYVAPLRGGKGLRFASTLPAMTACGDLDTSIDPVALHHYMTFHAVVPPPFTMFKGVRKLPPATVRVIEPDGTQKDECYWAPSFARTAEDADTPASVWEERVHAALKAAVRRRMVADVPVGVLLSGGVDSSLIVGLLAEAGQDAAGLNTFSIGFDSAGGEEGNEFKYTDTVSKHFNTPHPPIELHPPRTSAARPKYERATAEATTRTANAGICALPYELATHDH
mgnify:CR=1 FL=1